MFNKEKRKVVHIGSMHQYMLGASWLESSLVEKDLEVHINNKLTINQQCAFVSKEGQQPPELHQEQHCQKVEGRLNIPQANYSALVRPGVASPG